MPAKLDEIIAEFAAVPAELRLELLLDYANKLPSLPPDLAAERDGGLGRVPECLTPVFLWLRRDEAGRLVLFAAVADEAPTVKGIVSILVAACQHVTRDEAMAIPTDLVRQLGLEAFLRPTRLVGLAGIIGRVRRAAALEPSAVTP